VVDFVTQVVDHDTQVVGGLVALLLVLSDFTLDVLELQPCVLLHAGDDLLYLLLLKFGNCPILLHAEVLVELLRANCECSEYLHGTAGHATLISGSILEE